MTSYFDKNTATVITVRSKVNEYHTQTLDNYNILQPISPPKYELSTPCGLQNMTKMVFNVKVTKAKVKNNPKHAIESISH